MLYLSLLNLILSIRIPSGKPISPWRLSIFSLYISFNLLYFESIDSNSTSFSFICFFISLLSFIFIRFVDFNFSFKTSNSSLTLALSSLIFSFLSKRFDNSSVVLVNSSTLVSSTISLSFTTSLVSTLDFLFSICFSRLLISVFFFFTLLV